MANKTFIKFAMLVSIFLILLAVSGCKEVTYTEQVPYQVLETYYVDEPYTVNVPYDETETYKVTEPYQEEISVDLAGNPINDLKFQSFSARSYSGFGGSPQWPCVTYAIINNTDPYFIHFDINYRVTDDLSKNTESMSDVVIEPLSILYINKTFPVRGYGAYCNIDTIQITIRESAEIKHTNITKYKEVEKQRTVTKYKQEVRIRQVPKTRTVTKYQERLVTEKKLW